MNCQPEIKKWELSSPDEKVVFRLMYEKPEENKKSEISYEVLLNTESGEKPALQKSPLGIYLLEDSLANDLTFHSENKTIEIDETYEMIAGKNRNIHNHGFEKTVIFQNKKGKQLAIDFRVYDDGVAFRYRFPVKDSIVYTVTGEKTSFNLGISGSKWIHPYDTVTRYTPAYETYYRNGIPMGSQAPGAQGWAFPALFETNGIWLLLTESNLKDNFYGAHMAAEVHEGIYKIRLPEPEEALDTGPAEPGQLPPWEMPWRVIIIGEMLNTIVESNLVINLAEPSSFEDISWIKPGRASWSWWSDHDSPRDYNALIPFIDLAVEMGWEYSLVDANWNLMKNGDLEKIVKYANEKGIGTLVWYNSGGPHNSVSEQLRNAMHQEKRRKEEFQKLREWGVKGVKVDFFQSDKPHIIKLYHDILKDAEKYQILCNFHGCTIPRGWRRTYPHLLTLEAVKGAEAYSFDSSYPQAAPWHNTILPFTRNVIGPMDYTPVSFSDQVYPHTTTFGHELALSVVFESGIVHFADKVEAYLEAPDFVRRFLSEVPVTWEQTRFIDGYPGKYCVVARQNDGKWYLGAINGAGESQEVLLDLPFLPEGEHMMEIINDGDDDRSFRYAKKPVRSGDRIEVIMRPRGGFVAVVNSLD